METFGDLYEHLKTERPQGIELNDLDTGKILLIAISKKEKDIWDIKPIRNGYNLVKILP